MRHARETLAAWVFAGSVALLAASQAMAAVPPAMHPGVSSLPVLVDDPGLLQRVMDAVSVWSGEDDPDSRRVQAMSRGAASQNVALPLLASSVRQKLVGGTRRFAFAWVGGKPPFAAELVDPAGSTVARWPVAGEPSVAATVRFDDGFYELRITDASGQPVLGAFEVTTQAPVVDRRGIDQLPPDLGNALLAARLADMDGGAWKLEAYERLRDTSPGSASGGAASRVTANRLAQGLSTADLRRQGAPPR